MLSFELLVRRAIQLELAVARSPSNPEFTGLEAFMESPLTQTGAASTRALDLWFTERLKEKAQIQKQTRLFREEMGHGTRGQNQQHEDGAVGSGGGSWRRKAKKSAGAQGSGAADS